MFGRKKDQTDKPTGAAPAEQNAAPQVEAAGHDAASRQNAAGAGDHTAGQYDPVNGDFGPFDGDSVDYRNFDFSDFAKGGLDLGSMMVPVPHEGDVQVDVGPEGPQMIHIGTQYGRVTPVAFAAPKNGDLWDESVAEIVKGMSGDGLEATVTQGPWGPEVFAEAGDGVLRIMGVTGLRWMLRFTLAGPKEYGDQLAHLAHEMMARTFVMRGQDPIPAGNPLPVHMPQAMAEELQKQMQAQAEEMARQQQEAAGIEPLNEPILGRDNNQN